MTTPSLSAMEVVSFDGDRTLWDFDAAMKAALARALAVLAAVDGQAASRLSVERLAAIRDRVAASHGHLAARLEEVRRLSFHEALREAGRPDHALGDELNRVYHEERRRVVVPFPDVAPCLDALAGRFVLGVVSNGNTHPSCCGLGSRFAFVTFSEDHGVAKPDPRLFSIALEGMGVDPDRVVHVGDSLEDDVAGARAAGHRAVWLNRGGVPRPEGAQPDGVVETLAELPPLLGVATPS